jgi:K+-sensing histidine kinase KdpD
MAGKMATSTGLLAGYCGLAIATGVAIAVGGTRRPAVVLALLALTVLVLATRSTAMAALGTGAMAWLFYDGFIIGRHADLAWHGTTDLEPLALLLGAALCGIATSWLLARASERRTSALGRELGQAGSGRAAPVIVSLADARTPRRA